jgi:hypothetical protein
VHALTAELVMGELEFRGHVTQVAASVAPVLAEYVPARQFVHTALPLAILYVPAAHGEQDPPGPVYPAPQGVTTHGPPAGPVLPALQVQAVTAVLELCEAELSGHVTQVDDEIWPVPVEYVPVVQDVHAALPVASLYVPAPHTEHDTPSPVYPALQGGTAHGPPAGPVYPGLQMQPATAVLDVSELELPGHPQQVDASVAPVPVEYVPAGHSIHALTPGLLEYFPVGQLVQEDTLTEAPTTEYVPAGQFRQLEQAVPAPYTSNPLLHVGNAVGRY